MQRRSQFGYAALIFSLDSRLFLGSSIFLASALPFVLANTRVFVNCRPGAAQITETS